MQYTICSRVGGSIILLGDKLLIFAFKIYNFIVITMKDYERLSSYNDDYNFVDEDEFLLHNAICIKNLSQEKIEFMVKLCKFISKKEIMLTDAENFIEFRAISMYFNRKNKLVIMKSR